MHQLSLFAGLAWDPGIRGILTVLVAVVVLMGSVYLLLATNVGSRLGLLLALAAAFGWIASLALVWWITAPAIGPRGRNPSWKPVEVYVEGSGTPKTGVMGDLPASTELPSAQQIIADHPEIQKDFPNPDQATLSDLQNTHPEVLAQYMGNVDLGGWRIVSQANAGEAAAVADTALTTGSNIFKATSDYKHLATFDIGGKPTRAQYCPDEEHPHNLVPDDIICRIQYKFTKLVDLKHPPHYTVVQVQQVIPQTAAAGAAPPLPKVDPTKPVINIVMVRDLGQVRLLPATFFVVSFALFIFTVVLLHYRDKTLMRNRALAAEAEKAGV